MPAAAGARTTIPSLAAVNVFSANRPTRMVVSVPRAARWECGSISFSGGDGLIGFVLLRDTPDRKRDPIVGIRWPTNTYNFWDLSSCPDTLTIPAGRYLLYVLAGPSAGKIVLRLGGLRGRVSLAPTRAVAYRFRTPRPTFRVPPGNGVYWAGAMGSLRSRGLLYSGTWADALGNAADEMGNCAYAGSPKGNPTLSYGPMCPGGGTYFQGGSELTSGGFIRTYINGVEPGNYGLGGYYVGAGVTKRAGVLAFWLSYD